MKKYLVLFLIFGFISLGLLAGDNPDEQQVQDTVVVTAEKNQPVPKVSSIATKIFMPMKELPLSVGVVNQSLINNQDDLILGDALKNISGVNTQTGNGVHDYFIIRGMNSLENGLILTDGTLEPEVTYYNLYNVERVEVLKGPGAFLYGSNPLSGTVNLVRKQPQFGKFVNLQTSYGSYNAFRTTLDAGLGKSDSGFASRVNVLTEKSDRYRDDKSNKTLALNPSFTYFVNDALSFNLNIEFIKSEYKPDSGIPLLFDYQTQQLNALAPVDRKTSYQTPFDFSDQEITRIKFYTDYQINNHMTFTQRAYASRLDWQSEGTLINGAFPNMTGGMDVKRTLSVLDDVRDLFGIQNELAIDLSAGTVEHRFLMGLEWTMLKEDYTYDVSYGMPDINLFNPVETAVEDQIYMVPYLKGDVTNTVWSPYVLDQISFSDQIKGIIGFRYDKISFENKAPGYQTDRDYSHLSPLASLSYTPSKHVTLFVNAGAAYAPPSSQVVGDQEAEHSQQYEIGTKQSYLNDRINFDVSVYRLKKDGIPIPSLDGLSMQQGDQLSKGLEVEFRLQSVRNLFAFFSYAYTDAKLTRYHERVPVGADQYGQPIYMVMDRSGNRSAFTPKNIFNSWLTKEWSNGFGIGGGIRYLSRQDIYIDNVYQLPSATILDAIVFYKMKKAEFILNIKNLSDETYEMRGFGASSVIPADPRSIYGKIRISL